MIYKWLPGTILFVVLIAVSGETVTSNVDSNDKVKSALYGVSKSLDCFKDVLQDSIQVSRKCGDGMDKLTEVTKNQQKDQEVIMANIKKDLQQAITNVGFELTEELTKLKKSCSPDLSELERLTAENQKLKAEVAEKDKKVQELENKLEESRKREEKLTDDVKQLNITMESLYDKRKSKRLCVRNDNIMKLVQGLDKLVAGKSLDKGLLNLLEKDTEAYKQLEKVLSSNQTPLCTIGEDGLLELATLVFCAGLPVDKVITNFGSTMLHCAAYRGHLQLTKLLLQRGENLNFKNIHQEYTPLMFAVEQGHLEVVKFLVMAGADLTIKDKYGQTPLERAKSSKRTEIVKYLQCLQP